MFNNCIVQTLWCQEIENSTTFKSFFYENRENLFHHIPKKDSSLHDHEIASLPHDEMVTKKTKLEFEERNSRENEKNKNKSQCEQSSTFLKRKFHKIPNVKCLNSHVPLKSSSHVPIELWFAHIRVEYFIQKYHFRKLKILKIV